MYNDSFIKCFDIGNYNSVLSNPQKLDELKDIYLSKYKEGIDISGNALAFKESLDHYVLKNIMASKKVLNTTEFKNYFNYIQEICRLYPTERCTNPLFQIPDSKLEQVFLVSGGDYKDFISRKQMTDDHIKQIMNTISYGGLVSQEELNKVCQYYAGNRKHDDNYEKLITYIFTELPKSEYLKCSYQVLDSIFTYLPFEYKPEEMKEISNDDFNPKNIRVIFTDTSGNSKFKGPGVSLGNKPIVYMNRNFFENINFKSIANSEKTFLHKGDDFTFMMIVAFHEITHQLQKAKSKMPKLTEQGFMAIVKNVLNQELCDYKTNHDNDDIEIDATKVGWSMCELFYRKHYQADNLKELSRNCYVNVNSTAMRYGIATKKTDDGKIVCKDDYDIDNLNALIKSNPSILDRYPSLKSIYDEQGNIKLDILYKETAGVTQVEQKYIRHILKRGDLKTIDTQNLKDYQIERIIANIYKCSKLSQHAIKLMEYTKKHDNDGEYKKNVEDQERYDQLLKESFDNFYEMIKAYKLFAKTDEQKSFASTNIKFFRKDLLLLSSSSFTVYDNIEKMPYQEQVNVLNDVIQKASSIGVNPECIEYFDSRRRHFIEKLSQSSTVENNEQTPNKHR